MAQLVCKIILFVGLCLLLAPIDARSIDSENSLDIDNRIVDVTMFVMRNTSQHPSGLFIKANNRYKSECNITEVFSRKWNAKSLSGKSVLIWLDDYNEDGTRHAKFILANVNNCKYQTIYVGALSEKYQIYTSDNPSDETFTIMMRGKVYCQGHDWCRLHFDPLYETLQPFDFDFPLEQIDDIHAATPSNANLFVVSHTDDANTHRIRLYDLSTDQTILKYKELLTISNYTSSISNTYFTHYPVQSWDLSLCWGNLTLDNTTNFYCSEFTEDGKVALNLTTSYPDSVIPSRLVKAIPSRLLINMVFNYFEARDFSLLPELITGWGNNFDRMKSTGENIPWELLLDSFSYEHEQRNVMIIIDYDYFPVDHL